MFVTVGSFDGVHLGHAALLARLAKSARTHKMPSLAVYFPLPPKVVFSGKTDACLLTLPAERERLIRACGADRATPLEFTKELAAMSHRDFFYDILLGRFGARGLIVGHDFAFGHERGGHLDFLRQECAKNSIPLEIVSFETHDGHKVSSSHIRTLLSEGAVSEAAVWLGRPYAAEGVIVKGEGLGRRLGYPTANVSADPRQLLPRGVYCVRAMLGRESFPAVANIGARPTVSDSGRITLEVHLLDFSRDIYGKNMRVEFVSRIRAEKKFNSHSELCGAISHDVGAVRDCLGAKSV